MKPTQSSRLLPCDVARHPQMPVLHVLQAAAAAAIPALLHAHPAVAQGRLSTDPELAAGDLVRLAGLLRIALDNYRRILPDEPDF